jgi:hypothetical protein
MAVQEALNGKVVDRIVKVPEETISGRIKERMKGCANDDVDERRTR